MKIRKSKKAIKELLSVGILPQNVLKIIGKECKVYSRISKRIIQVQFEGKILGYDEPFLFCIPNSTIIKD